MSFVCRVIFCVWGGGSVGIEPQNLEMLGKFSATQPYLPASCVQICLLLSLGSTTTYRKRFATEFISLYLRFPSMLYLLQGENPDFSQLLGLMKRVNKLQNQYFSRVTHEQIQDYNPGLWTPRICFSIVYLVSPQVSSQLFQAELGIGLSVALNWAAKTSCRRANRGSGCCSLVSPATLSAPTSLPSPFPLESKAIGSIFVFSPPCFLVSHFQSLSFPT